MKISCALAVLLVAGGALPLPSQSKMLEQAVTVMEWSEFTIERGGCLAAWKPFYCRFPGTGYRLEVIGGAGNGTRVPRRYSIGINDGVRLSWPAFGVREPSRGQSICLVGRNVLRVTLHGAPGDRVSLRIHAQSGQVDLHRFSIGGPMIHAVSPARRAVPAGAQPVPAVTLTADRQAIQIGQEVRLAWDARDARSVRFTSGDLGEVGSSGSARVWPEKDTVFRVEAGNDDGKASAETAVAVAVPDPELELGIEPGTLYRGEKATLRWKTRNARRVRFAGSEYSSLPLSGSLKVEPRNLQEFVLQAENGEKRVSRSVTAKVVDRAEEERRAAAEKARRHVPPAIDRKLHGIWDGLRSALKAGDIEKAVSFFCLEERGKTRLVYSALKEQLPTMGAGMSGIQFIEFFGDGAKYRTRRKEIHQGREYDITYYVYFVRDIDGQWRIDRF